MAVKKKFKVGDKVKVNCPGLKKLRDLGAPTNHYGVVKEILADGDLMIEFPVHGEEEHSQVAPYPPSMVELRKTVKKKNTKKVVKKKKSKKLTTGKKDLTEKQERFCLAFVANRFNGVRAAEQAGYKGSYDTLGVVARENLKKPLINARVKELTNEYLQDKQRLGRDVINELYDLGMRKMSDIVTVDGRGRAIVKNFNEMGAAEGAINKIKIKQVDAATNGKVDENTNVIGSEIEVWLEGKTKPLEILAKHTGQIVEKSEHTFPNGEFANTREIDLSKVPTDKLKKIQSDLKAMEEIIPELKEKR